MPRGRAAALQTFEYGLWQAISRTTIPKSEQSALGNEVMQLVQDFLPLAVGNTNDAYRKRGLATGNAVHFFATRAILISACNRFARERLPAERITNDPGATTCQHCMRKMLVDPVSCGLRKLGSWRYAPEVPGTFEITDHGALFSVRKLKDSNGRERESNGSDPSDSVLPGDRPSSLRVLETSERAPKCLCGYPSSSDDDLEQHIVAAAHGPEHHGYGR